jgi:hypothetical protein
MQLTRAPLKIDSWHDCAVMARRIYHRAVVPMICVGILFLVAANLFPGLQAIVLSQP